MPDLNSEAHIFSQSLPLPYFRLNVQLSQLFAPKPCIFSLTTPVRKKLETREWFISLLPSTFITSGIFWDVSLLHTPRHTAVRAPRTPGYEFLHRALRGPCTNHYKSIYGCPREGVNTEVGAPFRTPGALNRRWPTLVAPVLFVEVEAAAPSSPSTTLRTRRRRRAPIW